MDPELFRHHQPPVLQLKAGHDDDDRPSPYLPLPDDDVVRRMESRSFRRYNAFLQDHWIDLLITDAEMDELQQTARREPDPYFGNKGRMVEVDLLFKRSLYRVFNNGKLTNGGRFYGGWWQNIKKDYRRAITINGGTTAELDYSSLHPSMLYALEGKTPPDDCYALDGFPKAHRDLLKKDLQQASEWGKPHPNPEAGQPARGMDMVDNQGRDRKNCMHR